MHDVLHELGGEARNGRTGQWLAKQPSSVTASKRKTGSFWTAPRTVKSDPLGPWRTGHRSVAHSRQLVSMVSGSLKVWDPRLRGAGSLANRLPSPSWFSGSRTDGGPSRIPGEDVAQERSALPEALPPRLMMPVNCAKDDLSAVMIAVDPHKASNTAAE